MKALEYLRMLEGARGKLGEIVSATDRDSVRIAALREIVTTIWREIELRQKLGLLPNRLADVRVIEDQRFFAEQVVAVLERYNAPQEAFEELAAILDDQQRA